MSLRKDWQTAKTQAEDAFKKKNPLGKDPHINPPKAFPVKFKEDLGPTLDKYEKTSSLNGVEKHGDGAKKAIAQYRILINGAKNDLGTDPTRILLDALKKIEAKID